jgi:hypothetical protein
MIFCDEPWCNEPGRESHVGQAQSLNYNRTIRKLTIEHALLTWARGHANGIWTTVVEKHFRANAEAIINRVKEWAKDGFQSRPSYVPPFGMPNIPPPPPAGLGDFDVLSGDNLIWNTQPASGLQPAMTHAFEMLQVEAPPFYPSLPAPSNVNMNEHAVNLAHAMQLPHLGTKGHLQQPNVQVFNEESILTFNFVSKANPYMPFTLPPISSQAKPSNGSGSVQMFGGSFDSWLAGFPEPPMQGYTPVFILRLSCIPDAIKVKYPQMLILAPLENMSGEVQHLLIMLGASPMQIVEDSLAKSAPMEMAIKDLIDGNKWLGQISELSAKNNSYIKYSYKMPLNTNSGVQMAPEFSPPKPVQHPNHLLQQIALKNQMMQQKKELDLLIKNQPPPMLTPEFTPSKPVQHLNHFEQMQLQQFELQYQMLMQKVDTDLLNKNHPPQMSATPPNPFGPAGTFTSAMMPSSTKPAYLFQPNPFAAKQPSPSGSPSKDGNAGASPSEYPGMSDSFKKTNMIQQMITHLMPEKQSSSIGSSSAVATAGGAMLSSEQLARQAKRETPILDEKTKELVALLEMYQRRETTGVPL